MFKDFGTCKIENFIKALLNKLKLRGFCLLNQFFFLPKLYIVAQDSSLHPQSATATVTVNVKRNRPPVFSQPRYTQDVSDASDIFAPFIVTPASDPDLENPVSLFSVFLSIYMDLQKFSQ